VRDGTQGVKGGLFVATLLRVPVIQQRAHAGSNLFDRPDNAPA